VPFDHTDFESLFIRKKHPFLKFRCSTAVTDSASLESCETVHNLACRSCDRDTERRDNKTDKGALDEDEDDCSGLQRVQ
jgi:hypothetical protein